MASLSTEIYSQMLAEQCAARHRTPKATVTHPAGVIVPDDFLLTENIKDPDYVPYCGPCMPMQRMRRNEKGFHCPTCHNRTNWDLTKFNGNLDVQFDPELVDAEWLAEHQRHVAVLKTSLLDADKIGHLEPLTPEQTEQTMEAFRTLAEGVNLSFDVFRLNNQTKEAFERREAQQRRSWDDVGKKNTGTNACGKCEQLFFGKRKRKYCKLCQTGIDQHLKKVHAENSWGSDRPKMNR